MTPMGRTLANAIFVHSTFPYGWSCTESLLVRRFQTLGHPMTLYQCSVCTFVARRRPLDSVAS